MNEGGEKGCMVGEAEGEGDRLAVGDDDGIHVGASEGPIVGASEGPIVGVDCRRRRPGVAGAAFILALTDLDEYEYVVA